MTEQPEPDLTRTQKTFNVAQSEVFQLAAYGHHRYHPGGEALTDEGKRQQRDYNDRIRSAREQLEAALLRLVAEHAETFANSRFVSVDWLRSLADDPAQLSLLAVRPDERDFDTESAASVVPPSEDRAAALTTAIYDALVDFQRTAQLASLQHAQIRQHLAEHLSGALALRMGIDPTPETVRAAVLLEAADIADHLPTPNCAELSSLTNAWEQGTFAVGRELRRLAAEARTTCPGYETAPNRCTCPCEGCRHNCAAHQPDTAEAQDGAQDRG